MKPLNVIARLLLAAAVLSATGCAHLPAAAPRPVSQAIPLAPDTQLGAIALSSTPAPDLTGFRLLSSSAYALDARLTLIRRAEHSLDLQYYLVQNDATGRLVLRALRDAAERGVRVRLLLDDLYTAGEDELLLGLQSQTNIEVGLFNPFPSGRGTMAARLATSLDDVGRVNHRMHNKLLIADGAFAVVGGRNIADEYFAQGAQLNFIDLDAVMVGGEVPRLQAIFDDYWNSPFVYPLQAIAHNESAPQSLRRALDEAVATDDAREPLPARDLLGNAPLDAGIESGRLDLVWAHAEALADPPEKITGAPTNHSGGPGSNQQSLRFDVLEQFAAARQEIMLNSPYLVPGPRAMEIFVAAAARGVHVSVLTNSLASTDVPLVYMGYQRHRRALLAAGVELYELSPSRIKREHLFTAFRSSTASLHAKTAVVDRRRVFLGSMNFDPRSASVNTEMGVFIDSPQLAEEVLRLMTIDRQQAALRVELDRSSGQLRWVGHDADGRTYEQDEPGRNRSGTWFWRLLAPFAPEQLL